MDEFKEEIAFLRNRVAELLNREPEVKIVEKTVKVEDTSKVIYILWILDHWSWTSIKLIENIIVIRTK